MVVPYIITTYKVKKDKTGKEEFTEQKTLGVCLGFKSCEKFIDEMSNKLRKDYDAYVDKLRIKAHYMAAISFENNDEKIILKAIKTRILKPVAKDL